MSERIAVIGGGIVGVAMRSGSLKSWMTRSMPMLVGMSVRIALATDCGAGWMITPNRSVGREALW